MNQREYKNTQIQHKFLCNKNRIFQYEKDEIFKKYYVTQVYPFHFKKINIHVSKI